MLPAEDDPLGGGWRAVCIRASVSQGVSSGGKETTTSKMTCELEFGTPITHRDGRYIDERAAQDASAHAANRAARITVRTSYGITAATCIQIKQRADLFLRKQIAGARVNTGCTTFRGAPVPVVDWP